MQNLEHFKEGILYHAGKIAELINETLEDGRVLVAYDLPVLVTDEEIKEKVAKAHEDLDKMVKMATEMLLKMELVRPSSWTAEDKKKVEKWKAMLKHKDEILEQSIKEIESMSSSALDHPLSTHQRAVLCRSLKALFETAPVSSNSFVSEVQYITSLQAGEDLNSYTSLSFEALIKVNTEGFKSDLETFIDELIN